MAQVVMRHEATHTLWLAHLGGEADIDEFPVEQSLAVQHQCQLFVVAGEMDDQSVDAGAR